MERLVLRDCSSYRFHLLLQTAQRDILVTFGLSVVVPAVPGVQRRQVREEDPDRRGLRVAGQSRPAQARGELAQAARQHRPDPLLGDGGFCPSALDLKTRGEGA